jgi:ketosteroid isomerase-like protein
MRAPAGSGPAAAAPMADESYSAAKAVARANQAFYKAFESLDLHAMRAVWLDADHVKCIHPGGEMLTGPERVHASWEAIFVNTKSIRFELLDLAIEVVGDLGCVTNVERISSADNAQDVKAEMAATNLFVRHAGQWKMILHHASPIARRFFNR